MKCSKEEVYIVTSHINYVFVVCALEVLKVYMLVNKATSIKRGI